MLVVVDERLEVPGLGGWHARDSRRGVERQHHLVFVSIPVVRQHLSRKIFIEGVFHIVQRSPRGGEGRAAGGVSYDHFSVRLDNVVFP